MLDTNDKSILKVPLSLKSMMDFQINNEIFCYGYSYQWHLLIPTPPMVMFYWYDDDTKEIKIKHSIINLVLN